MRFLILLFPLFFILSTCKGQVPDPEEFSTFQTTLEKKGVATGLHFGNKAFVEVGYFKYTILQSIWTLGNSYSLELSYSNSAFVFAPKASFWASLMGVNIGISTPYYFSNTGEHSLRIRPEIGLGHRRFKLVYGRNISMYHPEMENIGKHLLSFHFFFESKKV